MAIGKLGRRAKQTGGDQLKEVLLSGGNTSGRVVRIGDTVRRQMTESSDTVHGLLLHLERVGFSDCPRFLGIDEESREVLSYIDGNLEVPKTLWDSGETLVASAHLLRSLHDATASYVATGTENWALIHPDEGRHEVICHNDFAPYNFVFDGAVPVAVVDFDLAGPGPRLWDVAYAAYWMTPLSFQANDLKSRSETDVQDGCRRLRLFCSSYGIPADLDLLDAVNAVLTHMGDARAARSILGDDVAAALERDGHFDHWRCEAAAFERHKTTLEAVLDQTRD